MGATGGISGRAARRAAVDSGSPIVWVTILAPDPPCLNSCAPENPSVAGVGSGCARFASAGDSGPGSRLRDCCPVTTPPLTQVKTGNSEMSAFGLPTGSQGIQML